jgi:hypothetical protein
VAAVADPFYYIGNYSAAGTIRLVPYPLETCVPNGAFSYKYEVYHCTQNNEVYKEVYNQNDPTCESEYTTSDPWPISPTLARGGYADCEGERNYMEVYQYLSSCNLWESGGNPLATTIISTDACVFQQVDPGSGASIYARSTCDAYGQVSYVYAQDPSCSVGAALIDIIETPVGCSFYTTTTSGDVYSAMIRCVVDDVIQRCDDYLSWYEASVSITNFDPSYDIEDVYTKLFKYATVVVTDVTGTTDITATLEIGLCTQWEDYKYGPYIKDLGLKTLGLINNDAEVCWTCVDYICVNSTYCDTDNCIMSEQCYPSATTSTEENNMMTTTTSMMSSAGIFGVTIIALLLTLFVSLN